MKLQLLLVLAVMAVVAVATIQGKKHYLHHDHRGLQQMQHHGKVHRRDLEVDEDNAFVCPEEYGYYLHENCWQFWQCGNWIAYEMTCGPRTQWDQELLTCNHQTTCQPELPSTAAPEVNPTSEIIDVTTPNSEQSQQTTETPEIETTTATEEASTASPSETTEEASNVSPIEGPQSTAEPTTLPENENFQCPDPYGYYQHKDCWKFWQCGNWIAYEMTCSPRTQWDQELLTCNHLTTCSRP